MPRPHHREITFSIDGREVTAPENTMLVDGAKYGDVEIPVFCYEPKLGAPVGACRMCLVEIEGIPKLQTACSTPVKDGMVVHTQTERVHDAQRAVVEFLLVNHPLELSPLIAIDRERCILCYRCVRFSQEISEDYQLVLLERGAHSFVGTFDGHPYVGPFSGNIIELCPVGALTSRAYRFRARPWDIEGSGTVCTMCPAQCNVTLTVRDDRVMRVLARDHHEVDDGWLCDKGRFAYQSIHVDDRIVEPMVREGTELMPATWEKALDAAALQASVPDLEFAHAVLVLDCDPVDDAPILDLRIRKGVRRNGVRLAVASARPSALDPNAELTFRFTPGGGEALLVALDAALTGDQGNLGGAASAAGSNAEAVRGLADFLTGAGEDVVIVYGERLISQPSAARALPKVVARLGLRGRPGAGLLEIPSAANGRGLREAGFAPGHGPGYATVAEPGLDAPGIAASGDLSVL